MSPLTTSSRQSGCRHCISCCNSYANGYLKYSIAVLKAAEEAAAASGGEVQDTPFDATPRTRQAFDRVVDRIIPMHVWRRRESDSRVAHMMRMRRPDTSCDIPFHRRTDMDSPLQR